MYEPWGVMVWAWECIFHFYICISHFSFLISHLKLKKLWARKTTLSVKHGKRNRKQRVRTWWSGFSACWLSSLSSISFGRSPLLRKALRAKWEMENEECGMTGFALNGKCKMNYAANLRQAFCGKFMGRHLSFPQLHFSFLTSHFSFKMLLCH